MSIHLLQKVRNGLLATLAVLILFVVCVYLYSRYLEEPYLSYKPLPFPIVASTIYPGSVAAAIASRCNSQNRVMQYHSSRQIKRENSTQPAVILDSVEISAEPGCASVSTRANVVPEDTQPGFYRFSGVAIIKGLMVDHEVGWNTDVFEVVAKPKPENKEDK